MTMTVEKFEKLFDDSPESKAMLASLKNLCSKEYSLENLGFVMAVLKYRARHPGFPRSAKVIHTIPGMDKYLVPAVHWGSVDTYGRWIYDTFIDPAGPETINISAHVRRHLTDRVRTNLNGNDRSAFVPAHFDDAYGEIVRLIVNDTCKRLQVMDT